MEYDAAVYWEYGWVYGRQVRRKKKEVGRKKRCVSCVGKPLSFGTQGLFFGDCNVWLLELPTASYFLSTAKTSIQRKSPLRGALNVLQCFCERRPPLPARAVPTPRLVFHTPPNSPGHNPPTAQRPKPPAGRITILVLLPFL